jgi:hypothetical protein
MAEEVQYYTVDNSLPLAPPNGQVNGSIKLLNADGSAALPAVGLPTLPTANGDYTLRVAAGVYSWVLEGT